MISVMRDEPDRRWQLLIRYRYAPSLLPVLIATMTRPLSRRSILRALGATLAGTALVPVNVGTPGVARARRLADEPTGLDANVWAATMGSIAETAQDLPPRVYVPHENGGDVAVIDPLTRGIIDRYAVGRTPHHITP